jgi:hypothetical protein
MINLLGKYDELLGIHLKMRFSKVNNEEIRQLPAEKLATKPRSWFAHNVSVENYCESNHQHPLRQDKTKNRCRSRKESF